MLYPYVSSAAVLHYRAAVFHDLPVEPFVVSLLTLTDRAQIAVTAAGAAALAH